MRRNRASTFVRTVMGRPSHYGGRTTRPRRGLALAEAILGGVLLGVGLSVVMSIASRALRAQTNGEKRLVASWLADDLLNMVVAQGVVAYSQEFDRTGSFGDDFADFEYELVMEDSGIGAPWQVTAIVFWGDRATEQVVVETLVSVRLGDEEVLREPNEELDRDLEWLEREEAMSP